MSTIDDRAAQRDACMRLEEVRLTDAKARLGEIRERIRQAVANGDVEVGERMLKVEHQIDSHLATVERHMDQIRNESLDSWQEIKRELDVAWDDLAQSIKTIVIRVSGER